MRNCSWFSSLLSMLSLASGHRPNKTRSRRLLLRCEYLEERIALDGNSAGPNGIDALATGLTGQNVRIGQVEPGRPGLRGAVDNPANSHPDVTPHGVYVQNRAAEANRDVDGHATAVAGVMIANGAAANWGVARNALLHSSASREANRDQALISMQYLAATVPGAKIVGINLSTTADLRQGERIDSQSAFSRGTDYIAQKWDALIVVAPGRPGERNQLPADAWNVLVVGGANPVRGPGDVFRRVQLPPGGSLVDDNGRRLTHLIAPGAFVMTPEPTPNGAGRYIPDGGTSIAAAHATGTIALLQEDARALGLGDRAEQNRHYRN